MNSKRLSLSYRAKHLNAKPEQLLVKKELELTFPGMSFINETLLLEVLCFIVRRLHRKFYNLIQNLEKIN
jgi:hypothetical protein